MRRSRTSRRLRTLDAKWIIRFVVSAFAAGLLLSQPALALEPNALTSVAPDRLSPDSSPNSGLGELPALYLYQAPKVSSTGKTPGLMVYGGRAGTGGRLALTSDLYFGKTVRLTDMLAAHGKGLAPRAPGILGMSAAGAERQHALKQGRALSQTLAYQSRVFNLKGTYTSVDAKFQGLNELVAQRPEMKGLKGSLGMEKLELEGTLQPLAALGLQTKYSRLVNDKPGHKERGLTTSRFTQSLNLKPSDRFNLQGDFDLQEWEGKKEGSLQDLKLSGQFKPTGALNLNFGYQKTADDKPGSKKRGLTKTATSYDLGYALSGRTNLTAAYNTVEEVWNKSGKRSVKDTATTTLGLAHRFSGATAVKVGHQMISTTKDGKSLDTTIHSLHLEHKPGARFGLVSDITRKSMSNGTVDNKSVFKVNSAFGSGKSATALTGQWTHHETGQDGAQANTLTKLNLKSSANPLLQLNVDYTGDRRKGPAATKSYSKTVTTVTSRLTGEAAITARMMRETNLGERLTSERSVKLDFTPGLMKLSSRYQTVERGNGEDEQELMSDLFLEAGKPMREWARQASKNSVFTGVERFGVMTLPGWGDMPEGGVTYQMIRRDHAKKDRVTTKRLGYQTMLGRGAYLRLAAQQYPVQKKKNKTIILPIEEQMLEAGLRLGGRFNVLGRYLSHRDLDKDTRVDHSMLALRGAVGGGDRFSFAGGVQRSKPRDEGAEARMTFADLHAKIGAPLAGWAKEASNKGLFDDHKTYGHRDLPGWAKFADGGLHFQFVTRGSDDAASQATYLVGAQTMLGKRMYLKASLSQNPLNKKKKVVAGRRMLYEAGAQFMGKFTALARHISEHDDAKGTSLQSNYFGLRSRLSQRERLEAILVFDKVGYKGGEHSRTTYGLEYAREVDDGHYLTVKGTVSHDGDPSRAAGERKAYRLDLGFKKPI